MVFLACFSPNYVKSIRSFSEFEFSRIQTEYGESIQAECGKIQTRKLRIQAVPGSHKYSPLLKNWVRFFF